MERLSDIPGVGLLIMRPRHPLSIYDVQGKEPQVLILQHSNEWTLKTALSLPRSGACSAMAFSADGSILGMIWQDDASSLQLWDWRQVSWPKQHDGTVMTHVAPCTSDLAHERTRFDLQAQEIA